MYPMLYLCTHLNGYRFGGGTQSHTPTHTPAYPWFVPAWVSIPVSITNYMCVEMANIEGS